MKGRREDKNIAYLGLGSNLGNKRLNLESAISFISKFSKILSISSFFKNEAIVKDENDPSFEFLNCVVKIELDLNPKELFTEIERIELKIGKVKNEVKNWPPRKIDIDILLFNNLNISTAELTVPHLEIFNRDFVLTPLTQIDHTLKFSGKKLLKQRRLLKRKLPIIFSILNFTPDSFSDGGMYFNEKDLRLKINKEIKNLSHVIDIGCCSTRPDVNNLLITEEEEVNRIKKLIPILKDEFQKSKWKYSLPKISIDSFRSNVIKSVIDSGVQIDYINDVSGLSDLGMIQILKENPAIKIIIMHNLGVPAKKTVTFDDDEDIILKMREWFSDKLDILKKNGIERSRIIFDIGVGFGKKSYQNILIMKNIAKFFNFNVPIFVGHSRKSFLKDIYKVKSIKKLDEITTEISGFLIKDGIEMIRVH